MIDFKSRFTGGGFRQSNMYRGGGDPLGRWKAQACSIAEKHYEFAKKDTEQLRKSWHEKRSDGSYLCTARLSNRPIKIGDGWKCIMKNHQELLAFYEWLIKALRGNELDQAILEEAAHIKSMKTEALTLLKAQFPDSSILAMLDPSESDPVANKSAHNSSNNFIN